VSAPADLLAALADESRLRVFAALLLGSPTVDTVAARTGQRERDVLKSLSTLEAAGLVGREHDGWVARPEVLREAVVAGAGQRAQVDYGTSDAHAAKVLHAFMPEGRLEQLPASRSKRLVVLDHIARIFEPGVRYPESDVNAMLAAFHEDYATLRRCLVDELYLSRAGGSYWRSGGTVEL
jgi:hypothetical protein